MATTYPTAALGFCGIGIEGTAGTAVKSQVELDLVSENMGGTGGGQPFRTINRSRSTTKVLMGPYDGGGEITVGVTADKFTKILSAWAGGTTTAGTAAPYTHTWKTPTGDPSTLTVQLLRPSGYYFVYPGCHVNTLNFRASADEPALQCTVGFMARAAEYIEDAEASDVAIAASTADPLSTLTGSVTVGGGSVATLADLDLTIDAALIGRRGIGQGRTINRVYPGFQVVRGTFTLAFESISEHRKWMGAASDSYPINIANVVRFSTLIFEFQDPANPTTRKLNIQVGQAFYESSEPRMESPDGIVTWRLSFNSKYYATDTSDVVLTMTNGETDADIDTAGTDI